MDFKSFDFRSLKKLASPHAANDLNDFLEKLPQTAGQTALIAAGIAWMAAAALGLYTFIQTQSLISMRADLKETQALKPIVPTVRDVPVRPQDVTEFVEKLKKAYPDLNIRAAGSTIQITAGSLGMFGAFREAISHANYGGTGWRVVVENMCTGRECNQFPLGVLLKVNKVSVEKPTN